MPGGRKRRERRSKVTPDEDSFSKELKRQGPEGRYMAQLYLKNPMSIYTRKVNDESIRY